MIPRLVILLVVGLGSALAGLYLFRDAAIEALIANALAARGVVVGGLSVTRVGLDELRIADLRLGANGELRIHSLRVSYQPATLLRGEIETIAVTGLILRLDLTGAAPPLGSLQPLIATPGSGESDPIPVLELPVIELGDARIEAATRFGPVVATLDGEAWPEDAGEIAGAFSFTLESAQGRLTGAFELNRTATGATTGNLLVEDGALTLPGAEIGGLLGEASFGLFPDRPPRLEAEFSAARAALPGAELEEARITLRAAGKTAEMTARLGGADGDWSLALTATLEDYLAAPSLRFDVSGFAAAGAALWPLLALPAPTAGTAKVQAEAGPSPIGRPGIPPKPIWNSWNHLPFLS